MSKDEVS